MSTGASSVFCGSDCPTMLAGEAAADDRSVLAEEAAVGSVFSGAGCSA